eukprot:3664809-Ditylum_brightwellii.AAC.1
MEDNDKKVLPSIDQAIEERKYLKRKKTTERKSRKDIKVFADSEAEMNNESVWEGETEEERNKIGKASIDTRSEDSASGTSDLKLEDVLCLDQAPNQSSVYRDYSAKNNASLRKEAKVV